MLKTLPRGGIFKTIWEAIPKPSDRYFVGYDLEGNKYYEHPPTTDYKQRPKRTVKYPNHVDWSEVGREMPAQWKAWLRHTRFEPPSIQELELDLLRIQRTQENAARIEAAFAAQRMEAPETPSVEEPEVQRQHDEAELAKARDHYNTNPLEAFEPPIEIQEAGKTPEETIERVEERKHGFSTQEMQQRQEEEAKLRSQTSEYAPVYIYCIVFSFRFFVTTSMPKIRTQRTKQPPEGFEAIEQILDDYSRKMRDVEAESIDGKHIYDLYYKRKQISKELYDWLLKQGYADANLIAKWKKQGYEKLCCTRCIQSRDLRVFAEYQKHTSKKDKRLNAFIANENVTSVSQSNFDNKRAKQWSYHIRRILTQKEAEEDARRYFRLYSSGTLTYAVTDTDNVRDHVNLRSSVWLSHNNRRTVTIDGGTSTWHIKFTSGEEYVNWMKTLRIFLDPTPTAVPLETVAENAQRPPIENINKSIKLIDLIEFDLTNLKNGQNQVRTPPSSRSREQLHASSSHQGGLLNIFHKSPKLNSSSDDLFDTQPHRAYDAIFERLLDSTNDLKRLQQELHNMHNTQDFDTVNSRTFNNASRYAPSRTSSVNDFEFYDAQDTFGEAYEFEDPDEEDEGNDDVHDDEEDVDKEAVYDGVESSHGPHDSKYGLMQLPRRPQLPAPISGDEIGLLGVLKKNVGKDLTTISFPVSFNEPLSLLQKVAEDFEYVDLINKAIQSKSSVEKMACIAAFCVSSYSCTQYRSTRKPFNPLLGETYEYITPQFAFFSEKVTHHPPLVAAYAQGDGWSFVATSGVKQKFWGKSMEIIPIGTAKLTLKSTGDVYTW
ncbi:hypothetical protein E3Q24_02362 [Wallemia mellicola]|nr:hypothetical protein E3Q24_02362 [Wallemia mellicola]